MCGSDEVSVMWEVGRRRGRRGQCDEVTLTVVSSLSISRCLRTESTHGQLSLPSHLPTVQCWPRRRSPLLRCGTLVAPLGRFSSPSPSLPLSPGLPLLPTTASLRHWASPIACRHAVKY